MTDRSLKLSFDAVHDSDAGVWVATSTEGRNTTEAPTRDALHDVSITINWQELRTFDQTEVMVA